MPYRCAVLDDYQNVALKVADWSKVTGDADVTGRTRVDTEGSAHPPE